MLLALGTSSPAFASPIPGPGPQVAIIPGAAPAGAPVQVMGTNFTKGSTILIGYTTGDCSTNVTSISSASSTADGNGAFTITFQWPDTTTGNYYICATDSTTHVMTKSPNPIMIVPKPTLTASSPVYSGQPVTVTGAHYLPVSAGGSSVDVLYGSASNPCANMAGPIPTCPLRSLAWSPRGLAARLPVPRSRRKRTPPSRPPRRSPSAAP